MPRRVEPLAGLAEAPDSLTLEDHVHVLEDGPKPVEQRLLGLLAQRPFDTVDDLEPVGERGVDALAYHPLQIARRPLAVVVEIGQRPLEAILHLRELGASVALGDRRIGRLLVVAGLVTRG